MNQEELNEMLDSEFRDYTVSSDAMRCNAPRPTARELVVEAVRITTPDASARRAAAREPSMFPLLMAHFIRMREADDG